MPKLTTISIDTLGSSQDQSVPLGGVIALPYTAGQSATIGGRVFLASGIVADSSDYPNAPATTRGIVTPTSLIKTPTLASYTGGEYKPVVQGGDTLLAGQHNLVWTGSKFIRFIPNSWLSEYSLDGVTWVMVVLPTLSSNDWYGAASNGSGIVVAGANGDTRLVVSYDHGVTWAGVVVTATSRYWRDVQYLNGKFYAIGISGVFVSSSDAITWTEYAFPSSYPWMIRYGNGKYVVLDLYGSIYYSSTGLVGSWVLYPNTGGSWRSMGFDGSKFYFFEDSMARYLSTTDFTTVDTSVNTDNRYGVWSVGGVAYWLVYQSYVYGYFTSTGGYAVKSIVGEPVEKFADYPFCEKRFYVRVK